MCQTIRFIGIEEARTTMKGKKIFLNINAYIYIWTKSVYTHTHTCLSDTLAAG